MEKNLVSCVIVTYNRKELLLECLEAVFNQTHPVDRIILIDNASTDGTRECLANRGYLDNPIVSYVEMEKNTGGAGGFYEGIKRSVDDESDWVWIMDDDTIPTANCLEELLKALPIVSKKDNGKGISFLASTVYGPEGEYMNLPLISERPSPNGYAYWYQYLKDGIVSISRATFVSILVNKNAIQKCGLPDPDFFIWGDDSEYTIRLTTYYGDAFFVGSSVAVHKRKNAKNLNVENETDRGRIKLYHYLYRNGIIIKSYYSKRKVTAVALIAMIRSFRSLKKKNGFQITKTKLKGYSEAILQYRRFKEYIDSQLGKR